MSVQKNHWVGNSAELKQACDALSRNSAIAVDTEFMRTNTFYPVAALFQLACDEHIYLIDPLTIDDFSPLVDLFLNSEVTKVLHSCSEDMEVFRHFLGCLPEPLVDTQIAASFVGHGLSIGYAALVKELLDIPLEKGETRSDWLRRPLTDSQKHYAEQDVAHLLEAYRLLVEQLHNCGRSAWSEEEQQALLQNSKQADTGGEYYRRIKAAWRLSAKELATLKLLSDWREQEARDADKPRNHVIAENDLFAIAQRNPTTTADLHALKLPKPKIGRYGSIVLKLMDVARSLPEEEWPEPLPGPLPARQKNTMKRLKEVVEECAEKNQLEAAVLVKKNDLVDFVRSGMSGAWQLPPRLLGWRKAVVGDALLAVAENS